ncbi:MAG: hypothetical protein HZB45_27115 [Mycolicibacterium rufum]|nr:hypothetical protein [Mycolicibacterium rufum]
MTDWLMSHNQLERFDALEVVRPNDCVRACYLIRGALDGDRLAQAVSLTAQRHPVLSASVIRTDGELRTVPGALPVELRYAAAGEVLWSAASSAGNYPTGVRFGALSLPDSSVFAIRMLSVASDDHLLLMTADHSFMDARSFTLLHEDLTRAYKLLAGPRANTEPFAADKPMTFGEWTKWERRHLAGERLERLFRFWERQLANTGPLPAVGLAGGSRRVEGIAPKQQILKLSGDQRAHAKLLSRAWNVSEFSLLGVLFKSCVSAVSTICFGKRTKNIPTFGAFANRIPLESNNSIGGFANSVVITSSILDEDNLEIACRREAEKVFRASCHQDLPHALIVRRMDPALYGIRYKRDLNSIPRYLNFDWPFAQGKPTLVLDGANVFTVSDPAPELPRGGLRVLVQLEEDGWSLDCRYDPSVYPREVSEAVDVVWRKLSSSWLNAPNHTFRRVLSYVSGA